MRRTALQLILSFSLALSFIEVSFAQDNNAPSTPPANTVPAAIAALPKNIIDTKLLDNLKNCTPFSLELPPKSLSAMIDNLPESPEKAMLLKSPNFVKFLQTLNITYQIVGMNNNNCVVRVKVFTPERSSTMECSFPKEDLLLIYQYASNAMQGKYDKTIESNVRNSFRNCKKLDQQ